VLTLADENCLIATCAVLAMKDDDEAGPRQLKMPAKGGREGARERGRS